MLFTMQLTAAFAQVAVPLAALVVSCLGGWVCAAWWIESYGRRSPPRHQQFDAIVILGCRVLISGRPSSAFARRINLAVSHFLQGQGKALICTGGVGDAPFAESEVAAEIAIAQGVPAAAIWKERTSTTTQTNARAAADVFPESSAASVLIVTDAFHVWRARRVFARHFGSARGCGTVHPSWWLRIKGAMREVWAIGAYALMGRL